MANKQFYNLEDPQDVEFLLSQINDEMAVNSEAEGDEDAEDILVSTTPSVSSSRISSRNSSQLVESDEDEPVEPIRDPNEEDQIQGRGHPGSEEESSDTSDDSSNGDEDNWRRHTRPPQMFSSVDFQQPFGISNRAVINLNSPKQIFSRIFTSYFLQYVVDESNIYAQQKNTTLNLTVPELCAFLGLFVIMGFHVLPSIRLYWSGDSNMQVERIKSVMPLKRFLRLLRFLHLNDNNKMPKKGQPGYDKVYKVRPIIELLNKRFKLLFNPSRNLAVDESMIKFKGRSGLKQYMPMKPIKRGFKMWVIACAATGYCLGLSLYEGAEANDDKKLPLGERVVSKLAATFEGLGYCLFFDNFFSSIPMMLRLLDRKLFSCATIRQNRKRFPKNFLKADKQLSLNDSDGASLGELGIAKWKDRGKKSVCVASTIHNPLHLTEVLRTQKDGTRKYVSCPVAISEYNKYMGGVDHFDQLHATYNTSWKSRRWWIKIFYYCLDSAIVNSYILYKTCWKESNQQSKPLTHLQFRSILANELIGNFSSRVKRGPITQKGRGRKRNCPDGRPTVENSTRLINVGDHLPKLGTWRRCAFCSVTKGQQRSNIICDKCDVALCLNCFIVFHKS